MPPRPPRPGSARKRSPTAGGSARTRRTSLLRSRSLARGYEEVLPVSLRSPRLGTVEKLRNGLYPVAASPVVVQTCSRDPLQSKVTQEHQCIHQHHPHTPLLLQIRTTPLGTTLTLATRWPPCFLLNQGDKVGWEKLRNGLYPVAASPVVVQTCSRDPLQSKVTQEHQCIHQHHPHTPLLLQIRTTPLGTTLTLATRWPPCFLLNQGDKVGFLSYILYGDFSHTFCMGLYLLFAKKWSQLRHGKSTDC